MAVKYNNIVDIKTPILERILINLEKECDQAERWAKQVCENEWKEFKDRYEDLTFQCNAVFFELKKREVKK